MGSYCLIVTESVWSEEEFWEIGSVAGNVVNATESYTYKWLKC